MRKAYVDQDGILLHTVNDGDTNWVEVNDNFYFEPGTVRWDGKTWHYRAEVHLGIDRVVFRAGEGFTEHTHPYDQIIFLAEGKLEVFGKEYEAPKVIVVRAGVPHAPTARTDCYFINIRVAAENFEGLNFPQRAVPVPDIMPQVLEEFKKIGIEHE